MKQKAGLSTTQNFQFDIDYKRSIENGIDGAHNEFVHPTHGFSGENDDYKSPPIDMKSTKWGTGFTNKMYAPPLKEKSMRDAAGENQIHLLKLAQVIMVSQCFGLIYTQHQLSIFINICLKHRSTKLIPIYI